MTPISVYFVFKLHLNKYWISSRRFCFHEWSLYWSSTFPFVLNNLINIWSCHPSSTNSVNLEHTSAYYISFMLGDRELFHWSNSISRSKFSSIPIGWFFILKNMISANIYIIIIRGKWNNISSLPSEIIQMTSIGFNCIPFINLKKKPIQCLQKV